MRALIRIVSIFVSLILLIGFFDCFVVTYTYGERDPMSLLVQSTHLWLTGLGITHDNALAMCVPLIIYSLLVPIFTCTPDAE
jgi:hypothetical protein